MRVLITDGDERASLAAARALVESGFEVYVASQTSRSLTSMSRGVVGCVLTPDALSAPCQFATLVSEMTERLAIDVLLPITDPSVEALLEHRNDLPQSVRLPFPDLAIYRAASDKR